MITAAQKARFASVAALFLTYQSIALAGNWSIEDSTNRLTDERSVVLRGNASSDIAQYQIEISCNGNSEPSILFSTFTPSGDGLPIKWDYHRVLGMQKIIRYRIGKEKALNSGLIRADYANRGKLVVVAGLEISTKQFEEAERLGEDGAIIQAVHRRMLQGATFTLGDVLPDDIVDFRLSEGKKEIDRFVEACPYYHANESKKLSSQQSLAIEKEELAPPPTDAQPPSSPVAKHPPIVKARNCGEPDYPAESEAKGEVGTVILILHVDAMGLVSNAVVESSSGSERLDNAAIKALSKCKFIPGSVDGIPQPGEAKLKYTFRKSR